MKSVTELPKPRATPASQQQVAVGRKPASISDKPRVQQAGEKRSKKTLNKNGDAAAQQQPTRTVVKSSEKGETVDGGAGAARTVGERPRAAKTSRNKEAGKTSDGKSPKPRAATAQQTASGRKTASAAKAKPKVPAKSGEKGANAARRNVDARRTSAAVRKSSGNGESVVVEDGAPRPDAQQVPGGARPRAVKSSRNRAEAVENSNAKSVANTSRPRAQTPRVPAPSSGKTASSAKARPKVQNAVERGSRKTPKNFVDSQQTAAAAGNKSSENGENGLVGTDAAVAEGRPRAAKAAGNKGGVVRNSAKTRSATKSLTSTALALQRLADKSLDAHDAITLRGRDDVVKSAATSTTTTAAAKRALKSTSKPIVKTENVPHETMPDDGVAVAATGPVKKLTRVKRVLKRKRKSQLKTTAKSGTAGSMAEKSVQPVPVTPLTTVKFAF